MTDELDLNAETVLYSPHAEESVIAAAIIAPEYIKDVELEADSFYVNKFRVLWGVMKELDNRGVHADFITICNALSDRKQLEDVGGHAYIASILSMQGNASSVNIEDYADIVKKCSTRRKVMKLANKLASMALDKSKDLETGISEIVTDLATVDSLTKGAVHWKHYLEKADAYIQERAANPGKVWGIPTGIAAYDEITGGLQAKELRILSGDPGIGKSFYILQEATHMGELDHPGALYSLEMTGEAVGVRAINLASGVNSRTMKSGTMGANDWDAYYKALEHLTQLPVYMSDSEDWNTTSLRSDLARMVRLYGIEWAMVDYSYLLKDAPEMDEIQRSQLVIKACKSITKSLGIHLTVIHSKNKAGMGQETSQQSALRGSGQVIYDADVILFIENPDKNNLNLARCTFGKGRELENSRRYYDLIRLNGSPKYLPVETRKVNLNGK